MISESDYIDLLQTNPKYNEKEGWPQSLFPKTVNRYMKDNGSLVCSLAFLLKRYDLETNTDPEKFNPWILMERLISCGAYTSSGNLEIMSINKFYPLIFLGNVPYSHDILLEQIEKGSLCLIRRTNKDGKHRYLVVDDMVDGDITVFDPAEGKCSLSGYNDTEHIYLFRISDSTHYDVVEMHSSKTLQRKVKGKVAITFDDGPSPENTEKILEILKQNNAKATFFVIGKKVKNTPSVLRRVCMEGHQIGNHSWAHLFQSGFHKDEILEDMQKTNLEIERACGAIPHIMRPAGGYLSPELFLAAEEMKLAVIGWSLDSSDWQENDPEMIAGYILRRVTDGDIILLHDDSKVASDVLKIILPELTRRDLRQVTVDELAADYGKLQYGCVYNCL